MQKKAAKQTQRGDGMTFEMLAREWYAYNAPRWAESTAYKARLYMENDLIPGRGARPVKAITRPELVELVRKVEARGTLNAAGKIHQWLHQIFRFGLANGVAEAKGGCPDFGRDAGMVTRYSLPGSEHKRARAVLVYLNRKPKKVAA